jgi:beta-phosphoglucomutase-like phosphatase (HAD superfamily)
MADNEWNKFVKEQNQIIDDNGMDFAGKGKGARLSYISKLWAVKKRKEAEKKLKEAENITEDLLKKAAEVVKANKELNKAKEKSVKSNEELANTVAAVKKSKK